MLLKHGHAIVVTAHQDEPRQLQDRLLLLWHPLGCH
jgi:hypothetical protein